MTFEEWWNEKIGENCEAGKEMQMQQESKEKPFIVFWENDCGYGTDYYATEAEQETAIEDIRKTGTRAWPGYAHIQ